VRAATTGRELMGGTTAAPATTGRTRIRGKTGKIRENKHGTVVALVGAAFTGGASWSDHGLDDLGHRGQTRDLVVRGRRSTSGPCGQHRRAGMTGGLFKRLGKAAGRSRSRSDHRGRRGQGCADGAPASGVGTNGVKCPQGRCSMGRLAASIAGQRTAGRCAGHPRNTPRPYLTTRAVDAALRHGLGPGREGVNVDSTAADGLGYRC